VDSIKGLLLMNQEMSGTWRQELRAESLHGLSEPFRRFLLPAVTDRDLVLVPDASGGPAPDASFLFRRSGAQVRLSPPEIGPDLDPLLAAAAGERPAVVGSNNWVVAGWRSHSGKPILANDPHLALTVPTFWMPLRIEAQGRWWQGAAMTCSPGVILGQSDRLAWGFTNLGTDVQDLYREPPVRTRSEELRCRDGQVEARDAPVSGWRKHDSVWPGSPDP